MSGLTKPCEYDGMALPKRRSIPRRMTVRAWFVYMESSLMRPRRAAGGEKAKNGPHATYAVCPVTRSSASSRCGRSRPCVRLPRLSRRSSPRWPLIRAAESQAAVPTRSVSNPDVVAREEPHAYLLVALGLAAQDKPDFSGNWVLQDPPQPGVDIPRTLAIRQPLQRTTVLGEPMSPAFLQ